MAAAKTKTKRSKKDAKTKTGAARKRAASGVSMVDALAEAAWAEADLALAEALAELDLLTSASRKKDRAAARDLLAQSLSRAARKRGLARIGALGATETYDPVRHETHGAVVKKSKKVLIQARGVARGDEVLVRPRVDLAQRKKVRKKKRP
jgi:hypothetical protein